jgi:hypothetical protein
LSFDGANSYSGVDLSQWVWTDSDGPQTASSFDGVSDQSFILNFPSNPIQPTGVLTCLNAATGIAFDDGGEIAPPLEWPWPA